MTRHTTVEQPTRSSLVAMLSTRRPAGSKSERRFIREFIQPLGTSTDHFGNHWLRIGDAPIMWSCHTDTVHNKGGYQDLKRIGELTIKLSDTRKSNCLGADDTAGVWLMREMVLANVPGLYVFHREEEIGGNGSSYIAEHNKSLLDGIKFAVALDRRGFTDIITHQGSRCCSDEFAASLGKQLGMHYKACSGGVFTDTANYTDLIGECTNLSVGYFGAHSSAETLDGIHLFALRDKLINLDVNALVEKRKAGEVDRADWSYGPYDDFGSYYGHYYGGGESYKEWDRTFNHKPNGTTVTTYRPKASTPSIYQGAVDHALKRIASSAVEAGEIEDDADWPEDRHYTLELLVRNHPEEVADLLEQYGIDVSEVVTHIQEILGYVRMR